MRSRMRLRIRKGWSRAALLAGGLLCVAGTGCQTNIAGQTLPSGYFLLDDVQYFPSGPETKLINQIQALEEYRIQQQADLDGFGEGP